MSLYLLIFPFIIQAGATFFDEFYFHHKRGLPLWEKLGHPLDTLTVLACYYYITTHDFNLTNLGIYVSLAIFSCLFITKDEFVHHENSGATEQWLHSILFVIHPIVLSSLGFYWFNNNSSDFISTKELVIFKSFIRGQLILTIIFLTYQILYWSVPWKKYVQKKRQSTTTTTIT